MKRSVRFCSNQLRGGLSWSTLGILVVVLLSGCGSLKLKSGWRDREIAIDGNPGEWQGALQFMEKANVSLGLLNDDDFLYVCLVTDNRQVQSQLVRRGAILWFDRNGGEDKKFGIRYPLGLFEAGFDRGFEPPIARGGEPDTVRFRQIFEQSTSELEIIGPEKDDRHRVPVAQAEGIEARVTDSGGKLVYELRVPLHMDEQHPYAINASAGKTIGVGLVTPEINREMFRNRMRGGIGGRPGGGIGGRPGFGGMGGRPPGGRRPEMPEPLKVWAKVELANG